MTTDTEKLILELIREIKADGRELKTDLRELKNDMNRHFEQMDKRLSRIEDNQVREVQRLDEVYQSRDKVKITFGWQ